MYAGSDFPSTTPGEGDSYGFDFTGRLSPDDYVDSVTFSAFQQAGMVPTSPWIDGAVVSVPGIVFRAADWPVGSYVIMATAITHKMGATKPLIYWSRLQSIAPS